MMGWYPPLNDLSDSTWHMHNKKKTHPWHFGSNEFFFCHTYDTSMTIIVTKPGIIIDVVGSYFYDKNHDRKWAFHPGRAGDAAA